MKFVDLEVAARRDRLRVDDGSFRGDRDGLGLSGDQRDIDARARVDADDDAVEDDGRLAGRLSSHRVRRPVEDSPSV